MVGCRTTYKWNALFPKRAHIVPWMKQIQKTSHFKSNLLFNWTRQEPAYQKMRASWPEFCNPGNGKIWLVGPAGVGVGCRGSLNSRQSLHSSWSFCKQVCSHCWEPGLRYATPGLCQRGRYHTELRAQTLASGSWHQHTWWDSWVLRNSPLHWSW